VEYAIYFSSPISSAEERVVVEYGGENIIGFEEVVQRYVESLGLFAVNLDPDTDHELLRATLADRDIEIEPINWLMKGVPDILVIDQNSQVRFIEVKSPGDGLSDSQVEWALRNDAEISVAWVSESKSDVYREEVVKLEDEPVFRLDDTILGRNAMIDVCYNCLDSRLRRSKVERLLGMLKNRSLVSERKIIDRLELKSDNELREIVEPLMGINENGISVVLGYKRDGCKYFDLITAPAFESNSGEALDSTVERHIENFLEDAQAQGKDNSLVKEDMFLLTTWF